MIAVRNTLLPFVNMANPDHFEESRTDMTGVTYPSTHPFCSCFTQKADDVVVTATLDPPALQTRTSESPAEVFQAPLAEVLDNNALRRQWAALHDASDHVHPLLHPDCVEASFGSDSQSQRRSPFVHAILRDGRLDCLGVLDSWNLPIVAGLKWKRSGWRMFGKSLVTRESASGDSDEANSVDRAGHATSKALAAGKEARKVWLQSLTNGNCHERVKSLYVEALDRETQLFHDLRDASNDLVWLEPGPLQPRWRIQLPATVDEYWKQGFSSRSRNTLSRKKKKLGDYQLQVMTEPDEIPEFLQQASAVSRETWQSKRLGLRIRNDEREQHLFSVLAKRRAFRGYILRVDDRPVAFVYLMIHHGTAHYEETGYLPEMAAFSPGLILVSDVVSDAIAPGRCRVLDFGLGHAAYKEFLSNRQSLSEDLWILQRGASTWLDCSTIRLQQSLQSLLKSGFERTGLMQHIRRWSRGR